MIGLTGAASASDPYLLDDSFAAGFPPGIWRDTKGLSVRSPAIDPSKKTLVYISFGQSLRQNISPSTIIPTNASVVDQLNIYDGQLYSVGGALLGAAYPSIVQYPQLGLGNVAPLVADRFINAGKFDRVIIASIAVGGSPIEVWATGPMKDRFAVTMRRLAALGITPSTPGVTFVAEWGQGEADIGVTPKATYEAAWAQIVANAQAAGFSGRFFVALETAPSDSLSQIFLAQQAVVNNVTVFQGPNVNSITGAGRTIDGTHLSDAGQVTLSSLIYNAMVASGAPF